MHPFDLGAEIFSRRIVPSHFHIRADCAGQKLIIRTEKAYPISFALRLGPYSMHLKLRCQVRSPNTRLCRHTGAVCRPFDQSIRHPAQCVQCRDNPAAKRFPGSPRCIFSVVYGCNRRNGSLLGTVSSLAESAVKALDCILLHSMAPSWIVPLSGRRTAFQPVEPTPPPPQIQTQSSCGSMEMESWKARYRFVVLSSDTRRSPRALCVLSHPPADNTGKRVLFQPCE